MDNAIFNNSIAAIFQKIVVFVNQFALVPIFISCWGIQVYGDWIALTVIPTFFAYTNLGFGTAAATKIIHNYANKDYKTANAYFKTGFFSITALVVLLLILSYLLLEFLCFFKIFDNLTIPFDEAFWGVYLIIVSGIIGFFNVLFEGIYNALRKTALSIYLASGLELFRIIVLVIVLKNKAGVLVYAQVFFIVTFFSCLLYNLYAFYLVDFFGAKSKFDRVLFFQLLKKGTGYLTLSLWQVLLLQGATLILRFVLGPISVVLFNTVRTLINAGHQINSIIVRAILPEMKFNVGVGNVEKIKKTYSKSLLLGFLISLFFALFLLLCGKFIYSYWTNSELKIPNLMWILFLCSIPVKAIWWLSLTVFNAYDQPYIISKFSLLNASIALLVALLGAHLFGIGGFTIGYILMDVLMLLIIFPKSLNMLQMNIIDVFSYVSLPYKFK